MATEDRKFKLPLMSTMFPIKRNPLQDDPRVKEMINKLFEFSQMTPETYKKFKDGTLFPAYYYPYCSDFTKYVNLARIYQLFFVLDDHTECKWGDVAKGSSEVFWGQVYECIDRFLKKDTFFSMSEWKPYVVALYIAFEEMSRHYTEEQMRRFLKAYRDYGEGNQKECKLLENNYQVKNWDEYLEVRLGSIAAEVAFQMIEYSDGLHLTDEEWNDSLLQKLFYFGGILITLQNDIVSFEKEILEMNGDHRQLFNAVALHMVWKNNDCEVDEALKVTVQLYKDYEMQANEILQKLRDRPNNSVDVKVFIEGAAHLLGGNFESHLEIGRYNKFNVIPD